MHVHTYFAIPDIIILRKSPQSFYCVSCKLLSCNIPLAVKVSPILNFYRLFSMK